MNSILRTHRRRRALLDGTAATAALEFAIAAPLLIFLFLAIVAFGFYITLIHEVQELASSGARASVSGLTPAERNDLAQSFIQNFIGLSGLLVPADVTVSTATLGSPATTYSVTVTYNLKDTPLPALTGLLHMQANTIVRTAIIQFGGT